jgi:radical SAM-linked protein
VSNDTILLIIKFKIGGSLRFLSHAETLKLFQRACVRAGIKMQYSQGFNPRPKLSLPLPRTVGVASDEDMLCLRASRDLNGQRVTEYDSRIRAGLAGQLPGDCELLSVEVARENTSYHPISATYILPLRQEYNNDEQKTRIERLLERDSCNLQRRIDAKKAKFKNVNVRPFLKSIEVGDREIVVECKIRPEGTIRVDEILELLELNTESLTGPIKRTNVKWLVRKA